MKKLLSSLCVVVVLSSCSNEPSACDCAQMVLDQGKQMMKKVDLSEKEAEKLGKELEKLEKKIAPCQVKSDADEDFRKELERCFKEKMWE
tara:strand:+ start:210 stop:479 length:270 start_codon:yes stop_codon:yes gene_type:complete